MVAEGRGGQAATLMSADLLRVYLGSGCLLECLTAWSLLVLDDSQVNFDIELLRENFECRATAAFILVHFPLECALSVPLSLNIPLFACAGIDSEFLSSSSHSGLQNCSCFT
jgi:hypothetical protein